VARRASEPTWTLWRRENLLPMPRIKPQASDFKYAVSHTKPLAHNIGHSVETTKMNGADV